MSKRLSEFATQPRAPKSTAGRDLLITLGVIAGALVVLLLLASAILGYVWYGVSNTQIALRMRQGQVYEVVGAGVYTDLDPFADIQTVSTQELMFRTLDREVLTQDKQRIGVIVQGTVQRPVYDTKLLLEKWGPYKQYFVSDEALIGKTAKVKLIDESEVEVNVGGLLENLGQQAEKVCVGDSPFDKVVIGSSRDDLAKCVQEELDKLGAGYGLKIKNVTVPSIALAPEVQKQLDQITAARFNTQIAQQRALQAAAEADQNLATEQGKIRVEQGKNQETARQQAITAKLDQERLAAQQQVITQQKANDLLTAQKDLEIQSKQAEVAAKKAEADQADQRYQMELVTKNPAWADLKKAEYWAGAWKNTDKVIVPAGTNPTMVIGGQTVVTTPAGSTGSNP